MDELMITLLENNYFLYAACGSAGLGCLIQVVLSVVYNRSLNASERMRSTKVTWLRQMKTRYESGFEWDHRIRNVELFVDKNIGRRKLMGVYLKSWEELGRIMLPLTVLFTLLGAVCAITYQEEKNPVSLYLTEGAILVALLQGITAVANLKEKRLLLRTYLCDYFENTLRAEAGRRRREGRAATEQEFGLPKHQAEIACTTEENHEALQEGPDVTVPVQSEVQNDHKSEADKKSCVNNKKEQRQLKRQEKKAAAKVKRQEKKNEKEAGKLYRRQRKEQKRVDKLAKRMEKMQRRLCVAATAEEVGKHAATGTVAKDDSMRKREQLKQKVNVSPMQEDQIISEVLREFLA